MTNLNDSDYQNGADDYLHDDGDLCMVCDKFYCECPPDIEVNDTVRYSKPASDLEKTFRFLVVAINDNRVQIQLICTDRIMPIETVDIYQLEVA